MTYLLNMTSKVTPKKSLLIDCFICCKRNTKSYKLSGQKVQSCDFLQKLMVVLNDEHSYSSLMQFKLACVCRNCYVKIEHSYDFIKQLKSSALEYVSGSVARVKRCAASPLTPKSVLIPHSASETQTVKSRKQLKLNLPVNFATADPSDCEPAEDRTNISIDHGYSKHSDAKSPVSQSILNALESLYINMTKHSNSREGDAVMLQELRAVASTLTSRTAMFGSVLYKYRNIGQLEQNADSLLQKIVEEMIQRYESHFNTILVKRIHTNNFYYSAYISVLSIYNNNCY